jgi:hypothetical protein
MARRQAWLDEMGLRCPGSESRIVLLRPNAGWGERKLFAVDRG